MTEHAAQNFPRPFNENYDLIGTLGKGGMGLVYKALDKKLKREVAFKILDASADEEAIQRFYLEAQAMKELDHQNIVHVFDFGKQDNQLFIAMTYVQGFSLSDVLQRQSKLPFDACRRKRQIRMGDFGGECRRYEGVISPMLPRGIAHVQKPLK
ncbi:MAG: protein kinase [Fibrobacter sp.]|nr:protein kinase [Fibrobacter sp.]